jgi:glycerate kinase
MKVLIAPDSFKGALSAPDAAAAMARGVRRVWPDAECILLPVADGGEGTLETLVAATAGRLFPRTVTGPLGEPVAAQWGFLGDGETAVVELAAAAGLTQVPPHRRDPKHTTTYGVGELLRAALAHSGVRRVIVGLGGSATNDGGAGLLSALGFRLLDAAGSPLPPGGAALSRLTAVERGLLPFDPAAVSLLIASDVDNPLTGPRGASAVFGPQKGAMPTDVALLDDALSHYAAILGIDPARPGSGAAGGTTAALLWLFPNAVLRPGIDLVLDTIRFDAHLADADLVLTGEGRLDAQTLGGKAVAGVARRARAAGVPVGALVGALAPDLDAATLAEQLGVDAALPLAPGPCTLEESMAHTALWLEAVTERAARWMTLQRVLNIR